MKRWLILILLAFIAARGSAQTGVPVVLQQNGPARLLASVQREDGLVLVSFSGVFEVTVEVEGDRGLEVEAPTVWTSTPGWKVKYVERSTMTHLGNGRQRWRQSFILDPTTPSVTVVELKPLSYRNEDGRWQTIDNWKPIAVKVVTQIPAGDLKEPRERPVVEDPPSSEAEVDWEKPGTAIVTGVALLLLAALVLRLRKGRRSRNKPPEDIALYELKRLEAMALPEKGRGAQFHTLLANVVRRYLDKRYQFSARRLTTQEFTSLLEQTPLLTAEQKDFLRKFLHQCDLAKFAVIQVPANECAELCQQTRNFLNTTSGRKS